MSSKDIKEKVNELIEDSIGDSSWAVALGCVITLLFLVLVYFTLGLIFILAWNYVVPLFWTGAPELSIWHGICVIILLQFLKSIFTHVWHD